jgi:SNF2 family DNA or RNA helicase
MKDVLSKLRSPASLQRVAVPKGLRTVLRPYQQAGLNWLTEIRRFTPGLQPLVVHPHYIDVNGRDALSGRHFDLAITTYAMVRKLSWLKERPWYFLILDEAQAIKNPGSSQTKSVKEIAAVHRIVLTGTPVEKRLGDIWSLPSFGKWWGRSMISLNPYSGARAFSFTAEPLSANERRSSRRSRTKPNMSPILCCPLKPVARD